MYAYQHLATAVGSHHPMLLSASCCLHARVVSLWAWVGVGLEHSKPICLHMQASTLFTAHAHATHTTRITYGGAAQLEVGLPYATQPTRVHTYGGAAQLDSGLTS